MNKTVTASLAGLVFHIEEHGYEKLLNYLKEVKSRLGNDEDADEILKDIESRIAELFIERTADRREVVEEKDVDDIIAIMGAPADYGDAMETEEPATPPPYNESNSKKIYRDDDNRMLGGVCAGIANYFGWEVTWVRLAFLAMLFVLGTGVMLYLALWIILPLASTTAEKLEMKGHKVNAQNIKDHFKQFQKEVQDLGNTNNKKKIKDAGEQLFNSFGKILAIFFLVVTSIALIILGYWVFTKDFIFSITNTGMDGLSMSEFMDVMFTPNQNILLTIGVICVFIGPAIGMIAFAVKLFFNMKQNNKVAYILSGSTFAFGVIVLSIFITFALRERSSSHEAVERIDIDNQHEIIYLDIFDDTHFSDDFTDTDDYFFELIKKDDDEVHLGWPKLDIYNSNDGNIELIVNKYSRGKTKREAIDNAASIRYPVSVKGNKVLVSPYFTFDLETRYKGQDINVILKVPNGTKVQLSERMSRVLGDVDNEMDVDEDKLAGKTWIMRNNTLHIQ